MIEFPPAHAGYEAFYEGRPETANPHANKPGEEQASEEWLCGWLRGQAEEEESSVDFPFA